MSTVDPILKMLDGVDLARDVNAHRDEVRRILNMFLDVLDAVDRALKSEGASGSLGVIRRQLRAAFERAGVRFFDSVGQKFDPIRHLAVDVRTTADGEEIILEVIAQGCEWDGDLLRPAAVMVSKPVDTTSDMPEEACDGKGDRH